MSEKDITLEEWAERHPEVEQDVNRVTFDLEVPPPPTPPSNEGLKKAARVVRDITIGLVVAFLTLWLTPYVTAFVP